MDESKWQIPGRHDRWHAPPVHAWERSEFGGPGGAGAEKPSAPNKPNSEKPHAPNKPNSEEPHAPNKPNSEKPRAPNEPNTEEPHAPNKPNSEKPRAPNEPNSEKPCAPNKANIRLGGPKTGVEYKNKANRSWGASIWGPFSLYWGQGVGKLGKGRSCRPGTARGARAGAAGRIVWASLKG